MSHRRRRRQENAMVPILEEPEPSQSTLEIPQTMFEVCRSGDLGYSSKKVTIENEWDDDYDTTVTGVFHLPEEYSQPIALLEDLDDAVDPSYVEHLEEMSFQKPRKPRRGVHLFPISCPWFDA
jgi:hypothetical protein